MKMFCGVFVFGRVAATDMAANQAEAQVHPAVAHLQTFFAALGFGLYVLDLIEMSTIISHGFSSI
jgi:hypothetical protein